MNTKTFLAVFAVGAVLNLAPSGFAQGADADAGDHGRRGRYARLLAELSPDERARLRAAHRQAMADPAVQAAKDRQRQAAREFRELKRSRMLQADPTIQPILDKIPARGRRDR